jgi:hypothetical protein
MIVWWSKHVGVILNVLVCDIGINVLIQTSALVWPLYVANMDVLMPLTIRLPNATVRWIVEFAAHTASYFVCCIKQQQQKIWMFGQNLVTDKFSYEFVFSAGFYKCIAECVWMMDYYSVGSSYLYVFWWKQWTEFIKMLRPLLLNAVNR